MDILSKKYVSLLRYIIKIVYPKQNSYLLLIYSSIKYLIEVNRHKKYKHLNMHKMGLICKTLPKDFHENIVKSQKLNYYDFQHQVIVPECLFYDLYNENIYYRDELSLWINMKVFVKKCEIQWITKEKSYVSNIKKIIKEDMKFSFKRQSSSNKKHEIDTDIDYIERIVQIVPESRIDQFSAYVNEINYFNIMNGFNSEFLAADDVLLKFAPIRNTYYGPQIAEKIAVALINTSFNIGTDLIDVMLDKYFSTPKFLHENDYFALPLTEEYMKYFYFKYFVMANELKLLYFKCTKVTNKNVTQYASSVDKNVNKSIGYFVIKGQTELVQEQNYNSSIPSYKFTYINAISSKTSSINKQYIDNCPYGLDNYLIDVEKTITPFLLDKQVNPLHTEFKCILQPMFLLRGNPGSGRFMLMSLLAKRNGLHFLPISCHHITATTAKQTESKIDSVLQKAKQSAPVLLYLQNFEMFAIDTEHNEDVRITESFTNKINGLYESYTRHCIIIIASCDINFELKPNLSRIFLEEFVIKCLDREERLKILKWMILLKNIVICDKDFQQINSGLAESSFKDESNDNSVSKRLEFDQRTEAFLEMVASKTETFLYEDLNNLVYMSIKTAFKSYKKQFNVKWDEKIKNDCNLLREEDFENSIETLRSMRGKTLAALKVPIVQWDDVGGLDDLKKEIFRTIELPLRFPHIMAKSGLKRSGILLWGPPGCGKTLVARAIASQLKASFLSVKGPELLDMYVGQSEKNMRDIFASARSSAPCVIFFDEAEAAAGARGASGDAGGAADRLVSQLLAELDGVASNQASSQSEAVIVIAATNRPDLVEPALLRPGRLDKLLYVGPYKGITDKVRVLKASCRGYNLGESVDLNKIAETMPEKCTGADLASIVKQARHIALSRTINKLEADCSDASSVMETDIVLLQDDLQEALTDFVPSISESEMNYYESLKYKLS